MIHYQAWCRGEHYQKAVTYYIINVLFKQLIH